MLRRTIVVVPLLVLVACAIVGAWAVHEGLHHRLYRAFLYPVTALRVTRGATSPEAAARRLNQFTYLNIRLPYDAEPYDDTAADILIRGFGYCDGVDSVFVRLLEELDVPGRVTFLKDDQGNSPHSVSEVLLNGDWRVFDTFHGLVPRMPDGRLATTGDLATNPALAPVVEGAHLQPSWFGHADVFIPAREPPQGVAGRLRSLAHGALGLAPDWLIDRIQDLYLLLPPPAYMTDPAYPYHLTGPADDSNSPDGRLYFRARNYHIVQRESDAEHAYRELLSRYPTSQYRDDALYNLGLIELTEAKQPAKALHAFDKLDTDFPNTVWKAEVPYLEARAFEASGNCAAAAALYRTISVSIANGTEDARERLARLHC